MMPRAKGLDDGAEMEDAPITEHLPWFRFHVSLLEDPRAQRLDGETFKLYINSLCHCWRKNGVLPKFDELAWHLRLDAGVRLEPMIDELVQRGLLAKTGEEIRIPPQTLEKIYCRSDSSTERVRRHRNRTSDDAGETKALDSERNVTSSVSETFKSREEESREEENRQKRVSDFFDEFWKLYPKKKNRQRATEEYRKAIHGHEEMVPVILAAIASQRDQLIEPGERYCPDASTWLNQRRWEDEAAKSDTLGPVLAAWSEKSSAFAFVPIAGINPEFSGLLVAAVILACCMCLRDRQGRPLLSVAALLLSRGLFALAQGYDQFYLGMAIALRTFRTETAAAWRDAEESR
ncbi:MAG: hypothetical protein INH43_05785 [Acidobacteriaceae bacterium]|jgi:hypothetical protein|nr:hypothetical protein [Acidobacteriaceae bacterium]